MPPAPAPIQSCILSLLSARGPLASICPSEVARALAAPGDDWRDTLPAVREAAAAMAARGLIRVTQGQRDVVLGPGTRGPVRLRRGPAFARPMAAGRQNSASRAVIGARRTAAGPPPSSESS